MSLRARRPGTTAFVGRESELAALLAVCEQGGHGLPALAVVTGDAGLGKSRLVAELGSGFSGLTLVGGCLERGADSAPLAPFTALVRGVVRTIGAIRTVDLAGPSGEELARLAPELASVAGTPSVGPPTTAGQARLGQALVGMLRGLTEDGPLLVVLEDLHWADPGTLDRLPQIREALADVPATLVLTVRDEDAPTGGPLRSLLAELLRSPGSIHVELTPLSRSATALQLSELAGVPPSRALVDETHGRAGGNPYFVEELWAAQGAGQPLASTLRDQLLRKVIGLPAATRDVLRLASAAGRSVPHDLLLAGWGGTESDLEVLLDPAIRAQVLRVDLAEGRYEFRHALVAEATHETMLPGEARRVHARLAQVLERQRGPAGSAGDDLERSAALAHHWSIAGRPEEALRAVLAAARTAAGVYAFEQAYRHFEEAFRLTAYIPFPATERRADVLAEAAHVAHLAGRAAAAVTWGRLALEAMSNPLEKALAHERLGRYSWMAADGRSALEHYRTAVRLAPEQAPASARARILSGLAQALMLLGDMPEARRYAEEALELAESCGDHAVAGHAANNLGVALRGTDDAQRGLALLRDSHRLAVAHSDDVDDVARALVNLTDALRTLGRLDEAALVGADAVRTVSGMGLDRRKGVWCRFELAQVLLRQGELDQVGELVQQAQELDPAGVDRAVTEWTAGALLLARGDITDARSVLLIAEELLSAVVDGQVLGPFHTDLALCLLEAGDPGGALRAVERGRGRISQGEAFHIAPLEAVGVLAAMAVDGDGAGDGSEARRWLERCRRTVDGDPAGLLEPAAWLTAAEAAMLPQSQAASALEAAAGAWRAAGQPLRMAWVELHLARALLAAGDRAAAARSVRSAADKARAHGAHGLEVAAAALIDRANLGVATESTSTPGLDGYRLTPRERQVLELVTSGRTNREIGAALFVSPRTASTHVSNLLAKLGAVTRAEAAALAVREGLLDETP